MSHKIQGWRHELEDEECEDEERELRMRSKDADFCRRLEEDLRWIHDEHEWHMREIEEESARHMVEYRTGYERAQCRVDALSQPRVSCTSLAQINLAPLDEQYIRRRVEFRRHCEEGPHLVVMRHAEYVAQFVALDCCVGRLRQPEPKPEPRPELELDWMT